MPRVGDLRRAAAPFPWRTGTGANGLSPRASSIQSDDALALVIYVMRAETWSRWPTGVMLVRV
eukprot:2823332-Pyramimonas_sp.AAC.1